jgi:PAS domain S-box-containing protein
MWRKYTKRSGMDQQIDATTRCTWKDVQSVLLLKEVADRVREEIWKMRDSRDMKRVLIAVQDGLLKLGIPFTDCGVNMVDRTADPPSVRFYNMTQERQWFQAKPDDPGGAVILQIWKTGTVAYRRDLDAEDLYEEAARIEWGYEHHIRSVVDVPFSHGTLAVNSTRPNAFSERDIEILQEFVQVLSEGFTRSEDLRTLERRNQELEEILLLKKVTDRVREEIWKMQGSEGMEQVLTAVRDGLKELGVPFTDCGVNMVDKTTTPLFLRSYNMSPEGRWIETGVDDPGAAIVVQMWQRRDVSYRQDLDAEDHSGEAGHIEEVFGHRVRSVVDVPFSHGTLAINSTQPNAFSERDITILQELAQIMSEGFSRLQDLRRLEQHNRELEERERLLEAFDQIGHVVLSSLELERVVEALARQIIEAGIFRSLTVALVDETAHRVEIVENLFRSPQGVLLRDLSHLIGVGYALDDKDILAEAARTGEMQVVVEWDERLNPQLATPEMRKGQVAYFIPVKRGDRVLAVLATGSRVEEQTETLRQIEVMRPLLQYVAIALEHARLYRALQTAEERYRTLIDHLPIGIVQTTPEEMVYYNPKAMEILGLEPDDIGRMTPDDIYVDLKDREELLEHLNREGFHEYEYWLRRKDGVKVLVRGQSVAVRDHLGRVLRYEGYMEDVTEHKRAEEELRASEERFRQIAENLQEVLFLATPGSGETIYVNPAYDQVWGRPREGLYEQPYSWIEAIHPEDRERILGARARNMLGESEFSEEFRIIRPDRSIAWVWAHTFFIRDEAGRVYRIAGIARDISERKRVEEQLKTSLQEKEVLLKEIHHRVKNNLQVVHSLLNLQAGSIGDPHLRRVLRESQNRIKSMVLIHEELYRSDNVAGIHARNYVRNLIAHIFRSYGAHAKHITSKITIGDVTMSVDTAVPCGLILTELVSNAMKHAFPSGRGGEVCIDLHEEDGGKFVLVVRDNGVGIPHDLNVQNPSSLGLQLVNTLTHQLEGHIDLQRTEGTRWSVTFTAR